MLYIVAMVSLAGCQHWPVSAFITCMSILHPQPAIVSTLELPGSPEIDILPGATQSRGILLGGMFLVVYFSMRCEAICQIFLSKGVIFMSINGVCSICPAFGA